MGLVMQDTLNSNSDDEIDLRELFITLWAYKFLITCACALGIVFGGYYALNAEKEFTSAAIFKIDQSKSGGISLGGELGALANLAGFGGGIAASILPTDQVTGRIFIEKLDAKLTFQADPYFNTYDPNSIDPLWKSVIKRAVGWKKSSTTHVNPKRAAEISNTIMDEIISTLENKKNTEQDAQLSYLSNTLANALSDLEASQSSLKQFALENSALPLESFAARSLQLDGLREQLSRTTELYDAVVALSSMLENKTTDQKSYLAAPAVSHR